MTSVALVGAGISALVCAQALRARGLSVTLFEKSRGPGGRMSSRRRGDAAFDHGAQFFTARSPAMRAHVSDWLEAGVVARWAGRFGRLEAGHFTPQAPSEARFVGAPRMSALTRHLSQGLDLRAGVRVGRVAREGTRWNLRDVDEMDLGAYDLALISAPPAQAAPLLAASPVMAARAEAARVAPCWAVMARLDAALPLPYDAVHVGDSPLAWAARDSAKPQRAAGERWVLHATPTWSRRNLERAPAEVLPELLAAFAEATGVDLAPLDAVAHRWRYALAQGPFAEPGLFDPASGLGACGDWLVAGCVEGAVLSGEALARRVLGEELWRGDPG